MKRRKFITLLGGAATAAFQPCSALAQAGKPVTIGFLGTGSAAGWQSWTAVFEQRLSQLGWVEGRGLAIEYRWGEGSGERFAEFAADLVRRQVDVIVTGGSAVTSVKQATTAIPIVFVLDLRIRVLTLPASGSNCCAKSPRRCVAWRSLAT
jgi:putative ABC transport system substrate-binding protein